MPAGKKRDGVHKALVERLINRSKQAFTARSYKEARTLFDTDHE